MQGAKSLDIRFVQPQMDAHAARTYFTFAPWWLVPNQTRARAHMHEQRQRPAFANGRHWVLAVGSSPLRITFAAMAERVFGLSHVQPRSHCMPSFDFLHHGACMQVGGSGAFPCMVDVTAPNSTHRLTFVWYDGISDKSTKRTQQLLAHLLTNVELPDVLWLESGAWQWSLPVQERVDVAQRLLNLVNAAMQNSPLKRSQQPQRTLCTWMSVPWSRLESDRWGVDMLKRARRLPPPVQSNFSVEEYSRRMRAMAASHGCAFLDASLPCLSRASFDGTERAGGGLLRPCLSVKAQPGAIAAS